MEEDLGEAVAIAELPIEERQDREDQQVGKPEGEHPAGQEHWLGWERHSKSGHFVTIAGEP